jgi:SAM-dependent methyltransferase
VTESQAWEEGSAEWVERVRSSSGGTGHAHDDVVRSLLPLPAGLAVDAGCGEGRWTRALRAAGYDAFGVDRSEALVAAARAADPDGRYEVGTIDALPLDDGAATLVLCVNVLPHVVELEPAVAELARISAPGGVLVVCLAHPVAQAGTVDEERDELRVARYFSFEEHAIPLGHSHVFHQHRTIEQYMRAFLSAGFVLDDLRELPGASGSLPHYLDLRFHRP